MSIGDSTLERAFQQATSRTPKIQEQRRNNVDVERESGNSIGRGGLQKAPEASQALCIFGVEVRGTPGGDTHLGDTGKPIWHLVSDISPQPFSIPTDLYSGSEVV